jgi:arylsulfatase A-like enzyme
MWMQLGCTILTPHIRHIFMSVCQDSLRESLSLATNSIYGLTLLHLPPPHTPGIYLADKNQFTYWPMNRVNGYLNNLALADRELGQIRRVMESSGQWDKTWLIVSADHSSQHALLLYGTIDHRVPFIIKPPGAGESASYPAPINTVLTHDLILAILRGKVTNQQNLLGWLDANGKPIPTISGKIDN